MITKNKQVNIIAGLQGHYLLALFIVQNLKNILIANTELWRRTISGPKKGTYALNMKFLETQLIWFSCASWPLSLFKISNNP